MARIRTPHYPPLCDTNAQEIKHYFCEILTKYVRYSLKGAGDIIISEFENGSSR